ncbi:uncharacterized protein V6R79_026053 [Siganus canaliculatus]
MPSSNQTLIIACWSSQSSVEPASYNNKLQAELYWVESVHSRNEQRLRLPDFWDILIGGDRLQSLVPDPCEDAEFPPQRTKFARQRDALRAASERPAAEAHRTSRAPPKRQSATSASQQSNKPLCALDAACLSLCHKENLQVDTEHHEHWQVKCENDYNEDINETCCQTVLSSHSYNSETSSNKGSSVCQRLTHCIVSVNGNTTQVQERAHTQECVNNPPNVTKQIPVTSTYTGRELDVGFLSRYHLQEKQPEQLDKSRSNHPQKLLLLLLLSSTPLQEEIAGKPFAHITRSWKHFQTQHILY